jgi:pimeloyl-ACP methyl ester carboxylesterase
VASELGEAAASGVIRRQVYRRFVTAIFLSQSRNKLRFVTVPPRVLFVHGSVGNAEMAWAGQRPLEESFDCVFLTRSGYPPRPPLERIDFEEQAEEVAAHVHDGDHLVGHSYGGVVSLLVAARRPVLRSLTVSEPPAFGLARRNPAVEEFLSKIQSFRAGNPTPSEYLAFFMPLVGSALPVPDPLPPLLEQGARAALAERPPQEAVIPLETLATTSFPKLVLSGGHHPAFDAVCDVLESGLGAERAVLPGFGHSIARNPDYNRGLADFVERAERPWDPR